jgi:alkylmercury lyase-like protein
MDVPIRTAEELTDPELAARLAARRADRHGEVLQRIYRRLIADAGPVDVAALHAGWPGRPAAAIDDALETLDAQDLILLRDGRVELAYPFSGVPTPFVVILSGDRERYACCAVDALGIAAMVGQRIRIRSRCHHCGEPLAFSTAPDGPDAEATGIMVWVGRRDPEARRVCTTY